MTNASDMKSIILLILMISSQFCYAEIDKTQIITSASIGFDTFRQAGALHGQYEISLFLDASYLDKSGIGIGYILQNQKQDVSNNIVNDLIHYNIWLSRFPESLPGKISFALNYYHGNESTRTGNNSNGGAPGPGPGKPRPVTVSATDFSDSLTIINPLISFINYEKTFYLDSGYARSEYKTSDNSVGNLKVSQWSPAIGIAFNDQYDWLQIRYYAIELSNDNRTPGIDNTSATNLSWTHWFKNKQNRLPDNINITLLTGERLYGVNHDIRKIYNLTDLQTGSIKFGAHWKIESSTNYFIYTGYEEYKDITTNNRYNSLFIYTGLTTGW